MKKLIGFFIVIFVFGSMIPVHAQNHDSVGQEQALDHFMLSLFEKEISDAVKEYYEDDSINYIYDWWNKDYDVVEVLQTEKGRVLENSYIVKFTVLPQKEKELGTDTVTFGVEPGSENGEMEINKLDYSHKAP